jgi:protoheme IX farnesyltransferase
MRQAKNLFALTKPRLVLMVLVTVGAGFYLASQEKTINWISLIHLLLGTALAAGGSLALNQYMERDIDGIMGRTQSRPLPGRRVSPTEALLFGITITAIGQLYLILTVNLLASAVIFVVIVTYLFVYTPLKRRDPISTFFGSISGALPPVAGWVAVTGQLNRESWVLFGILFLWQLPHSLALAWMYRHEYAKAGVRLLPVAHPNGKSTAFHIVFHSILLLLVASFPKFIGLAGWVYFAFALVCGFVLLAFSIIFALSRTTLAAKRLMHVSLLYLPIVFLAMVIDKA